MADSHSPQGPKSPMSQLLHKMGLTRSDLARHSEHMRQFLSDEIVDSLVQDVPQSSQPKSKPSRPSSLARSRASSFANASGVAQSPTPPVTPIKTEPMDGTLSARQLDTMEMVIERKRKESKQRRDSSARSRDARRVQIPGTMTPSRSITPSHVTPETPHHYKYYSERVVSEASTSQPPLHMTPSHRLLYTPSRPQSISRDGSFNIPGRLSINPQTPMHRSIYSSSRAATPCSSPARIVNVVSSPGPMQETPLVEDDEEDLPFVLPSGPYSGKKPDASYAAIIGQAILSSPHHRLTLQHIYEWITTVYPHYKRGEQTWMNSVRHALSTMAVFRKVPRGRMEGKSLWAIFDCDVAAFAGGGFSKALCADMAKGSVKKVSKKRGNSTMEEALSRKVKRRKGAPESEESSTSAPALPLSPLPVMVSAVLPPYFPAYPHSNPHHQPYYQTYMPQPAEVVFPPLPSTSSHHRVPDVSSPSLSRSESSKSRGTSVGVSEDESAPPSRRGREPSPKHLSSSMAQIPDLTPNHSSSSSPPPSSGSSWTGLDSEQIASPALQYPLDSDEEGVVNALEREWLRTIPAVDALEPGVTLHDCDERKSRKTTPPPRLGRKRQPLPSLPVPVSPTLERGLLGGKQQRRSSNTLTASSGVSPVRMPITPATLPPRTPPPRQRDVSGSGNLQLSPMKTPLSHRGLHMSPSTSLAHYKSHLEPPPSATFLPQAPFLSFGDAPLSPLASHASPEAMRTPSRKRVTSGTYSNTSPFAPVTPKRLFSGLFESPARTPSRSMWDPHNPSVLLDEELARRHGLQESPGGIFGSSHGLLYESPNGSSPGHWDRYW